MKLKTLLKPVVTLLTVTALMGALLAGVNFATRDAIAQAKAQKTARAIAAVLPGAAAPEVISFEDDTALVQTVYRTDLGYAVETAPAGFGGSIALMVGVAGFWESASFLTRKPPVWVRWPQRKPLPVKPSAVSLPVRPPWP